MVGRIKSVKPTRVVSGREGDDDALAGGYLFVTGEDGVDRFLHRTEMLANGTDTPMTEITESLVGLYVQFEPALSPKGPRAIRARLLANSVAA